MKEKTAIKKLAKFFSLMKYDKKNYFYHVLQSAIRWLNPIIHVVFIEKITFALTNKDLELLQKILMYYLIFVVWYEFLRFLVRKIWWVLTVPNA